MVCILYENAIMYHTITIGASGSNRDPGPTIVQAITSRKCRLLAVSEVEPMRYVVRSYTVNEAVTITCME